jgi:hypothetical protein
VTALLQLAPGAKMPTGTPNSNDSLFSHAVKTQPFQGALEGGS